MAPRENNLNVVEINFFDRVGILSKKNIASILFKSKFKDPFRLKFRARVKIKQ